MSRQWKDLTLEEAVARAKVVSRQALHIAIKVYTLRGRQDVVAKLECVRKELKRTKRIEKVGLTKVERMEAAKARKSVKAQKLDKN